jgi:hypothetical protein
MKSDQVEVQSEFAALPWHHRELGLVFRGTPPGTCSGCDPRRMGFATVETKLNSLIESVREIFCRLVPYCRQVKQCALRQVNELSTNITVVSSVRIIADGLASIFRNRPQFGAAASVNDISALRPSVAGTETHIVLIDVAQGVDLWDVRVRPGHFCFFGR